MCTMASVEVSVLRTPWSINIILVLLHRFPIISWSFLKEFFPKHWGRSGSISSNYYVCLCSTSLHKKILLLSSFVTTWQTRCSNNPVFNSEFFFDWSRLEETIDLPTFEETPFGETEKRGLDMWFYFEWILNISVWLALFLLKCHLFCYCYCLPLPLPHNLFTLTCFSSGTPMLSSYSLVKSMISGSFFLFIETATFGPAGETHFNLALRYLWKLLYFHMNAFHFQVLLLAVCEIYIL